MPKLEYYRDSKHGLDQRKIRAQSTKLRVISGKFKGQRLASPGVSETHPMGAREKIALFNMVEVADKSVLDVFAGSGALGIEALSRGAMDVVFVENAASAVRAIRHNLISLAEHDSEIMAKTRIYMQKMANFIQEFAGEREFGVILADPPYDKINPRELQELVKLMARGGVLMLSSPAKEEPLELVGAKLRTSRVYAAARLTIYER